MEAIQLGSVFLYPLISRNFLKIAGCIVTIKFAMILSWESASGEARIRQADFGRQKLHFVRACYLSSRIVISLEILVTCKNA